jgi:hypothetical protein
MASKTPEEVWVSPEAKSWPRESSKKDKYLKRISIVLIATSSLSPFSFFQYM